MSEPKFFTFKNGCEPIKLIGSNKNILLKKIVSTNGRIQDFKLTIICLRKADNTSSSFPMTISTFPNFKQPANDISAILDKHLLYTEWDEVEIVPSLITDKYNEFDFIITYVNL